MNTSNNQTHVVGRSVGRGNPAPVMLTFNVDESWKSRGLCNDHPYLEPDVWFEEDLGEFDTAAKVCRACPVRMECLEAKVANEEHFGVWAGMLPGRNWKTYERRLRTLKRERNQTEANCG